MTDLAFAARLLRKEPVFTIAAILILAVAIAGNTAAFSAVNVLLLEPLPFKDGERLIVVGSHHRSTGTRAGVSYAQFRDWTGHAAVFEATAAVELEQSFDLSIDGQPARVAGGRLTADLLPLLGLSPIRGRHVLPDDERPGAPMAVLLTERFWTDAFGRDERAVGRAVIVDGEPATIVGVLPSDFRLLYGGYALWVPLRNDRARADRSRRSLQVIARPRPDVTLDQAAAALDATTIRLAREYPESDAGWRARVLTMRDFLVAGRRHTLMFVVIALALLLLVACANVAGLQLARATARQREIATRLALGASRPQIVRLLLVDACIIAAASGLLAVALVVLTRRILLASSPELRELTISTPVLAFTLATTLATATAFGLVPALTATRLDLTAVLRGVLSKRYSTKRLRSALIVAELAAALVLLVPAGLLVKSFQALREIDPGFTADKILTFSIALHGPAYADAERTLAFYDDVLLRLAAIPGVRAAAAADALPLDATPVTDVRPESAPTGAGAAQERTVRALTRTVTPAYLSTLGIPLRAGRHFSTSDDASGARVAIVNEALAAAIRPDRQVIGSALVMGEHGAATIVGVAADLRSLGLRSPPQPEVLVPLAQRPRSSMAIALSTATDPAEHVVAARAAVRALDPDLAVARPRPLADILDEQIVAVRVIALLLAALAALALVLAIAGLWGIMSWAVTQRTHEVGVRAALGATRSEITVLLMRDGLVLVASGTALGVPAAAVVARLLASVLWGVEPADASIFVFIPATLALAACAACFVPARRVARRDPAADLRAE